MSEIEISKLEASEGFTVISTRGREGREGSRIGQGEKLSYDAA